MKFVNVTSTQPWEVMAGQNAARNAPKPDSTAGTTRCTRSMLKRAGFASRELVRIHSGRERLARTQLRFERQRPARVEAQDGDQLEATGADGAMVAAPVAVTNFPRIPVAPKAPSDADIDRDEDSSGDESHALSSDSKDGMRYFQASPMSAQQLAVAAGRSAEERRWEDSH